jgi:coproporphyrinogen dehydrogenase HemZ
LIEPYLDALYKEMDSMLERACDKGYNIRNVYIGGGTPTSIPPDSLAGLLEKLGSLIPGLSKLEFTVEAGRPDCLDAEKLQVLRKYGVSRISINPQTMNDEILKRIGRCHSSKETIEIFHLARSYGFPIINMDIIIGLPGESPAMVEHTLKEISKLRPENLTVHTLAIKRASRLRSHLEQYVLPNQEEAEQMLMISQKWAAQMGMVPYYLYRQKYMMGNLENIGYCYPGKECAYNIQIMEENRNILALGAGAITKWIYPQENRLERFPNVKNIEDYIYRIDDMIQKKLDIL